MGDDLPYQQAPLVDQLLAERALASAYGQTTRLEAVDKQLGELGYKSPKQAAKAADAAKERAAAAAEDEGEGEGGRAKAPEGRSGRARQTTDQAKAEKKA